MNVYNSVNGDQYNRWLECFVGGNYSYYMSRWVGQDTDRSFSSWNWAAFFFGSSWMLYRKMYKQVLILVVALLFCSFLLPWFYGLIRLATGLIIAIYGNSWYYKKAEEEVERARNQCASEMAIEAQLIRRGGTNLILPLVLFVLDLFGLFS